MSWSIERQRGAAVVTMNSNRVNRQNADFFADLEEALNRLERDFSELPIVLSSAEQVFSAGFDFDYWFPLIARDDQSTATASYNKFKRINLRLFTYPRPTVAAIAGHAYAGGLITALCCDFRVAAAKGIRLTLNEVPIGLAMPSLFTEIIRYAIGTPLAAKATLSGRIYSSEEAFTAGIVDYRAPQELVLDKAIEVATLLSPDCWTAYTFSKEALQAPTLKRIGEETELLDQRFGETWCSDDARAATKRSYASLKARKG